MSRSPVRGRVRLRLWAGSAILLAGAGMMALDARASQHAAWEAGGAATIPESAQIAPRRSLSSDGMQLYDGAFGAAIAVDPTRRGYFYLLSGSRGTKSVRNEARGTRMPAVTEVGLFRLENGNLVSVADIMLRRADGSTPIAYLQGDGLAVRPDRSFWISDRVRLSFTRFDRTGRQVQEVAVTLRPDGWPSGSAPEHLRLRGLAISPDGTTLWSILRSESERPQTAGHGTRLTYLVAIDTRTGESRLYRYEPEGLGAEAMGIAALSATRFLVLEREDSIDVGDTTRRRDKQRVFAIDVADAKEVRSVPSAKSETAQTRSLSEALTFWRSNRTRDAPVRKWPIGELSALGYVGGVPDGVALLGDGTLALSALAERLAAPGSSTPTVGDPIARAQHPSVGRVYFLRLASALR